MLQNILASRCWRYHILQVCRRFYLVTGTKECNSGKRLADATQNPELCRHTSITKISRNDRGIPWNRNLYRKIWWAQSQPRPLSGPASMQQDTERPDQSVALGITFRISTYCERQKVHIEMCTKFIHPWHVVCFSWRQKWSNPTKVRWSSENPGYFCRQYLWDSDCRGPGKVDSDAKDSCLLESEWMGENNSEGSVTRVRRRFQG